jgi:4'-phosphopantetheinyl transferase
VVEVNDVTIWTMTLEGISTPHWQQLAALLDAKERVQAQRFAFERHQRQYTAAHALKRLMLTAAVKGAQEPTAWSFEVGAHGKPRISGAAGPQFNLSHCEGLVACAVSFAGDIGVDVECLDRQPPLCPLDPNVFAGAERTWLQGLPGALKSIGFFQIWTLKEAYIKATGLGLTQRLDTIAFGVDPPRVTFSDPALGDATAWGLEQRIMNSSRHILAAAWRASGPPAAVKVEEVGPDFLLTSTKPAVRSGGRGAVV